MSTRDPGRAAYLAFVRDHHPDRGGDTEAFIAGIAEFRSTSRSTSRSTAGRPSRAQDRYDAPIILVVRRRGLAAIPRQLREWRKRRRRGPRVQ